MIKTLVLFAEVPQRASSPSNAIRSHLLLNTVNIKLTA
jgi:hypothetical protein